MHIRAASGHPDLDIQTDGESIVADDMLKDTPHGALSASRHDTADNTLDALLNDEPDRPHEACGVVGIYAPGEDVARLTFFALFALQHRGQESAGIVTGDGARLHPHVEMGLVNQVFDEPAIQSLTGHVAIGHTRYSTTGSTRIENAQPICMTSDLGEFALAHNGNLTNMLTLRARLLDGGETTRTTSDTELIAILLARAPGKTYIEKIQAVMPQLEGAYSLVLLTPTEVIGIRDPHAVRPLTLGRLKNHWMIASETCAIDTVGGEAIRDIEPGEVIVINGDGPEGMRSFTGKASEGMASCLFEYIYFARPDSSINNRSLYLARQRMGAKLAEEYAVEADIVIPVPDSATPAAAGYAAARKLPFAEGLIKNRYIGRTFIQPDQNLRQLGVKLKFNALSAVLKGKRVVMIDDSIVRGTTTRQIVRLLRDAGAVEVHLGVTSPPFRFPCYLGLDVARRSELIAARLADVDAIAREFGADSLHYLSLDSLVAAIDLPRSTFCTGCFTGKYPVPVNMEDGDKFALEPIEPVEPVATL
ncbi:MAG TPA: amidophosphoribosyltransferase [Ktedonobacterales bacterium]|nr:amidophosphoribosyltransferase [Ktedonobacterales bacterium]